MAGPYAGPGRHVDSGPRHRGSALLPRHPRCGPRTFNLRALLCSGLRRSEQRPDLPNLCSHGPAQVRALAGPDPMLEIAVAIALGPARASCPTVHTASCPTRYRRLSTGVTGSSPRSTAAGFGQIGEAPYGSDASGSGLCDADARRFAAGAERAEPGRRGRPAHA